MTKCDFEIVWAHGINFKTTVSVVNEDPKLPDSPSEFCCLFDNNESLTREETVASSTIHPFVTEEYEVRNLLQRQNICKAAGTHLESFAALKCCADELATGFTDIFNRSLEKFLHLLSSFFIIPVPKKSICCLNDYRPVTLTSVIVKISEHLVCKHLSDAVSLDPYQFA